MLPKRYDILVVLFRIVCVSGAISTTIWCWYEYSKNEDMCEVFFKKFLEDDESVYPDITIMFPHQFNETAIQKHFGNNINSSSVRKILQGEEWDDRIMDIKLEDISGKLHDYLNWNCILSSFYESCNEVEEILTTYLFGMEAHTFRFSRKSHMIAATFQFRTEIFNNGINPSPQEAFVAFQYPNRVYRAQGSLFDIQWSKENENLSDNRQLTFSLKNMEVLRRRHKKGSECLDLEDFDTKVTEEYMIKVGCRPNYYNSSSIENVCKTKEEIQQLLKHHIAIFHRFQNNKNDVPPCTEIQKLQIDYSTKSAGVTQKFNNQTDTWFEVRFDIFTDSFKVIKQNRAYSTQSLIGNIGGYLGLCIGFSLLDLLTLIVVFCEKIRNTFLSILNNSKDRSTMQHKKNAPNEENKDDKFSHQAVNHVPICTAYDVFKLKEAVDQLSLRVRRIEAM